MTLENINSLLNRICSVSPTDVHINIKEWMRNARFWLTYIFLGFFSQRVRFFSPFDGNRESWTHIPRVRACCLLIQLCTCRCIWQKIRFQFLRITYFIENWGCYQGPHALGNILSDFVSSLIMGLEMVPHVFHLEPVLFVCFLIYSQVPNFLFNSRYGSIFYVSIYWAIHS